MDLGPVSLFNLSPSEQIGPGGRALSGMGKKDQPEGLAVQAVDKAYLFTILKKHLGAPEERTEENLNITKCFNL